MVMQQQLNIPSFVNQTNDINSILMGLLKEKQAREEQGGFSLGNLLGGAASGAATGAKLGGPKGAIIGGALGAGAGAFSGGGGQAQQAGDQGLANALMQIGQTQGQALEDAQGKDELMLNTTEGKPDLSIFDRFKSLLSMGGR